MGSTGSSSSGSSSDTLDDDVISANTYNGVVIMGGSSHDIVENSMIGTDLTGTTTYYDGPDALGNGTSGGGGNGVVINTGSTADTLTNDVISGNDGDGVLITGPGTQQHPAKRASWEPTSRASTRCPTSTAWPSRAAPPATCSRPT